MKKSRKVLFSLLLACIVVMSGCLDGNSTTNPTASEKSTSSGIGGTASTTESLLAKTDTARETQTGS